MASESHSTDPNVLSACADLITDADGMYVINDGISFASSYGDMVADNLTLDGVDIKETLEQIKERLLILEPNFAMHEKYPALKDAYEQYKMLEKLLNESNTD